MKNLHSRGLMCITFSETNPTREEGGPQRGGRYYPLGLPIAFSLSSSVTQDHIRYLTAKISTYSWGSAGGILSACNTLTEGKEGLLLFLGSSKENSKPRTSNFELNFQTDYSISK